MVNAFVSIVVMGSIVGDFAKALADLQSEDIGRIVAGAEAVASMGTAAPEELVTSLGTRLSSDSRIVRGWAAYALGQLDERGASQLTALHDVLDDTDPAVRVYAAISIVQIASASKLEVDPEVCKTLAYGVQNLNRELQVRAAEMIARVGPTAQNVLAELAAVLYFQHYEGVQKYRTPLIRSIPLRSEAEASLLVMFTVPGEKVIGVQECLVREWDMNDASSADNAVCIAILRAMSKMGDAATGAAPFVESFIYHKDREVRLQAYSTLMQITRAVK